MTSARSVLALLAASLALLQLVPPATAADPAPSMVLTAAASPATALPGSTGTVTLALKNAGTATAYQMAVTLQSADAALGLNDTRRIDLGSLGPGDATSLAPYTLRVASNAAPGVYRATFQFDYAYTVASTGATNWGTQAFSVTLTVRSAAALFLDSVSPPELAPGRTTNLTFTLHNGGNGPVENVVLTWQAAGNAILPVGAGNTLRIPRIAAGADGVARVPVTTAVSLAPGLYVLTCSLRYTDASGAPLNATMVAGLVVDRPSALEVALQEWTLDGLVLAVNNVGTAAAGAVEVRLVRGGSAVPAAVLLGNLEPGDFTTATFAPDAVDGAASPMSVLLSYTDATGERHAVTREVAVGAPPQPVEPPKVSFWTQHPWLVAGGAALVAVLGTVAWSRLRRRAGP